MKIKRKTQGGHHKSGLKQMNKNRRECKKRLTRGVWMSKKDSKRLHVDRKQWVKKLWIVRHGEEDAQRTSKIYKQLDRGGGREQQK
jgi:hypothetical protein